MAAYRDALAAPGAHVARRLLLTRTDGVAHWVEVRATNLLDDPVVNGVVLNGRDVTEQVELEAQVHANERRFRAMVEHADELIMVVGPTGAIDYQSPASRRVLGPFTTLDEAIAGCIPPEFHGGAAEAYLELVGATAGRVVEWTVPMIDQEGVTRVMHLTGTNLLDDPDVGGLVINGNDVTARAALEDGLRRAATTDPLTGLPNRTHMVEVLQSSLAAAADHGLVAVLFLDLDRFKVVNDSFGHGTGDRVLVELSDRLRHAVPDGVIGRFGGDEYVVVVPVADADAAVARADALGRAAVAPFSVAGPDHEQVEVYLSGSIGIALGTTGSSPDQLLHHADAAMYRAKERGRGTWELYDDGMREAALSRLTLEAELARALDDRGFELHYQPIVEVATGRVRGLEALARWRHRERGLVSPAEFIPVAEETGGIHRLGAWALASATSQLRSWQSTPAGELALSVNLSPRQLTRDELAGDVAELLKRSGISPEQVTLEITETLLMDDLELAVKALSRLRDTGVRLALDDFGTGWSSLTYLRSVPVDVVKIDRSFIQGVATSPDDRAIVGAVIAMCRALDKQVVAEGVETEAQFRALRELGCTHAQGFLFARPLPAPAVGSWLERYGRAGHRDPDAEPT
jgi:diguanylate cyclase (GGDEF)-like protein